MTALFPASGAPASAAPRSAADGSPIYTVSQLTRQIREAIERHVGLVWLTGEVGNLRVPASGHCYFTLKDESAQIAAVMWRTLAETLKFRMAEGLAVLAQGEVTVYEPRGQYQISVRRIEPLGVGALQLAFLQMKERLEKEGLFDPARKRPIPMFPRVVALVTSPTGAAVRDMLRVIRRRCPATRVLVCPVRVQGGEAAGEIADGIALVNRLPEVEVMIVGRGGGSLEDLWPFNEEVVARAIARSRIPVVSAVGHETDFTISDFVADLRALTPTDAANQVTPDARQLAEDLDSLRRRLGRALTAGAASARERLAGLAQRCEPRRFDRAHPRPRAAGGRTLPAACPRCAARGGSSGRALERALGAARVAQPVLRAAARLQHHAPRAAGRGRPRRRRPAPRRPRPHAAPPRRVPFAGGIKVAAD